MAVKTFTQGEKLTASDTNTYLNNGGLVYITSLAFSASATATINNCFTATYRSYRVILDSTGFSTGGNLYVQLCKSGTPTASNYNWAANYVTAGGLSGSSFAAAGTAVSPAYYASSAPEGLQILDIIGPFATQRTVATLYDMRYDGGNWVTRTGGFEHNDTSSHDGIRFTAGAGTMSGVMTIYGYRQA